MSVIEKDIVKQAKDLRLNEKYIRAILDGSILAISIIRSKTKKKVLLMLRLPTTTGKQYNPIIKTTKDDNQELVDKIEKFVKLVRTYRAFRRSEKIKENYVVSLIEEDYGFDNSPGKRN